jgi:hypothetical protein
VRKPTYYELKDVKLNRRLSFVDLLGPLSNTIKVPVEAEYYGPQKAFKMR